MYLDLKAAHLKGLPFEIFAFSPSEPTLQPLSPGGLSAVFFSKPTLQPLSPGGLIAVFFSIIIFDNGQALLVAIPCAYLEELGLTGQEAICEYIP
jgi:hypothetical protein